MKEDLGGEVDSEGETEEAETTAALEGRIIGYLFNIFQLELEVEVDSREIVMTESGEEAMGEEDLAAVREEEEIEGDSDTEMIMMSREGEAGSRTEEAVEEEEGAEEEEEEEIDLRETQPPEKSN